MPSGGEKAEPHRAKTPPRFRFSLAALCVVVTSAAIASCCLGLMIRRVSATSLTADEANSKLFRVNAPRLVPKQATTVDLEAGYNFAYVSFELPIEQYREYCRERNWNLKRFEVPPDRQPSCTQEFDGGLTIGRGYYSDNSTHRGGIDTWYDLDRGRAWIQWARR